MTSVDPNAPTLPPSGWYADPSNPTLERWWAGPSWTEHVREVPTALIVESDIPVYASVQAPEPEYVPAFSAATSPLYATTPSAAGTAGGYVAMGTPVSSGTSNWTYAVGSPNTVGVWIVATYPLAYALVALATQPLSTTSTVISPAAVSLIGIVSVIAAAVWDHFTLKNRGLAAPSIAWILLTGAGYLIARRFALRRDGVRHNAPGLAFVGAIVLGGAILGTFVAPQVLANTATAGSSAGRTDAEAILELQKSMELGLEDSTGSGWSITCPEDQDISILHTKFTCSGASTASQKLLIPVTVVGDQRFQIGTAQQVG